MDNKDQASLNQEKVNILKNAITDPKIISNVGTVWMKAHLRPQLITVEEMAIMGIEGARYTGDTITMACILTMVC